MKWHRSPDAFIRYLERCLSSGNTGLSNNDLYSADEYIEKVYNQGLATQYSKMVKNNPLFLKREYLDSWLSNPVKWQMPFTPGIIFSPEFFKATEALNNEPGVYRFTAKDNIELYIGRSSNLGQRIISSYLERFVDTQINRGINVFASYIQTKTKADAAILEPYFIAVYSPILNRDCNWGDLPSFEIDGYSTFSKPVIVRDYDFLNRHP